MNTGRVGICLQNININNKVTLQQQQQQQQSFYGPLSGTTRVRRYQKKHSPNHHPDHHPTNIYQLLPSTTINSILLIPSCSNYVLGNLFPQPLSMSSLVYLVVWSPPPHIPYISSPNQCLLSQHMPIPSQPVLL